MKNQYKILTSLFAAAGLVLASPASAAITVGSGTIQGSGDISFQASSGNVGIGTATPSYKLHVSGGYTLFDSNIAMGDDAPNPYRAIQIDKSYTPASGTRIGNLDMTARMDITGAGNYPMLGINNSVWLDGGYANSGTITGIYNDVESVAFTGGSVGTIYGLDNYILTARFGGGGATTVYGIHNYLDMEGSAHTNVYGDQIEPFVHATAGVTNMHGYYMMNPTGGGTLTNLYGVYVQALTAGTNNVGIVIGETTGTKQTNLLIGTTTQPAGSYSIYNSSTDQNYFAGNVGIGSTTPGAALDVQGGVNLEKGTSSVSTNAVTISKTSGVITDSTDVNLDATRAAITLTNTRIASTSVVVASICSTPDAGARLGVAVTPGSGSAVVTVYNSGTANQTSDYKICFVVTN